MRPRIWFDSLLPKYLLSSGSDFVVGLIGGSWLYGGEAGALSGLFKSGI